ncbi:A-kinase anchor protein 17A [Tachyglossus aculeatus]|uniref:A-kinase anchor protein 17A n=1 Tax=Tachyglossus aculeatus TaxID=9261 RepID=UPI0018F4F63F|nr:A-kinase anchor protein 17A [Tachyglossus aculeatus]
MAAATIVHDPSEAVELCPPQGLYLKPITKMTISVALPQLKQPGKSISNWEVMERLKAMVQAHQFSTLRISKSTMDFIRFEGEVENKSLIQPFLARLDGKTIKLSGFSDTLKVRAAEFKTDFPTRHDWDSFFRDAEDMNETLPGERPDTVHLGGLPCKWFARKESGSEKPSEAVVVRVFEAFGEIRTVDIPMLDPYREEMTGRNFHTFSFGGHLNFEAYVQYREYAGFVKAMNALRGMKLMYKGDDGKAVACNIKVSFDSTKHLSDASIKKRQLERRKLQELEQQREEQKRKEKEAEERQKEEERKQKELEELEKERKREAKLRKREQKQKARETRRNQKKLEKIQAEEQKKLQEKIKLEERKLLLAQRNLQSIRLIAELLSRAKAAKVAEREQTEERVRAERERQVQEAELRRVEEEKERALGLHRKEQELRQRLIHILLSKRARPPRPPPADQRPEPGDQEEEEAAGRQRGAHPTAPSIQALVGHLAQLYRREMMAAAAATAAAPSPSPSPAGAGPPGPEPPRPCPGVLACIPANAQPPKGAGAEPGGPLKEPPPALGAAPAPAPPAEPGKCNREPGRAEGREDSRKRPRSRDGRPGDRRRGGGDGAEDHDDDERRRKERRPRGRGPSPRRRSGSRGGRRERTTPRRDRARKTARRRQSRSLSRHRSAWTRTQVSGPATDLAEPGASRTQAAAPDVSKGASPFFLFFPGGVFSSSRGAAVLFFKTRTGQIPARHAVQGAPVGKPETGRPPSAVTDGPWPRSDGTQVDAAGERRVGRAFHAASPCFSRPPARFTVHLKEILILDNPDLDGMKVRCWRDSGFNSEIPDLLKGAPASPKP